MRYKRPRNDGSPSKRKFKGFNFYIQCNDKLSQKNRERLLKESRHHLSEVTSSLNYSGDELSTMGIVEELDRKLSDYELLEQWNGMYERYGYLMSRFSNKWEEEKLKDYVPEESPTVVQMLMEEIESLKRRVGNLEDEVFHTSKGHGVLQKFKSKW